VHENHRDARVRRAHRLEHRDVAALLHHDHVEGRDDGKRGDEDDQQQYEEVDRLLELQSLEDVAVDLGPALSQVRKAKARVERARDGGCGVRVVEHRFDAGGDALDPEQRAGVVEIEIDEAGVVLDHPRVVERADHEAAAARQRAERSCAHGRHGERHRVAQPEAEALGELFSDHQRRQRRVRVLVTLAERRDVARSDVIRDPAHARGRRRIDAARVDAEHAPFAATSICAVMTGAAATTWGSAATAFASTSGSSITPPFS
jgi:hypothetical protein